MPDASTDLLERIVEGLNRPPFSRDLTPIKLDAMSPDRLLQASFFQFQFKF
jgi:hypothetical protein